MAVFESDTFAGREGVLCSVPECNTGEVNLSKHLSVHTLHPSAVALSLASQTLGFGDPPLLVYMRRTTCDLNFMCAGKMIRWVSSVGAHNTRGARMTHVIKSGGAYLSIPDDKHRQFQENTQRKSCTRTEP